jgi:hypothetical protein
LNVKKTGFALTLAALLAMPGAAMAQPTKADTKAASAECHALVAATGHSKENMASLSGGEFDNFGSCVSDKAREEAAERKAARKAAREACAGTKGEARRDCVRSEKAEAKAKKDAKDEARVEAAESCTTQQEDGETFAATYGDGKNAYGKCVSAEAKKDDA